MSEFKIDSKKFTIQEDLLFYAVWRHGVNGGMPSQFAQESADAAVMFFRSLTKPDDAEVKEFYRRVC